MRWASGSISPWPPSSDITTRPIARPPPPARPPNASPWAYLGTEWPGASERPGAPPVAEPDTPLDAERILRALAEHRVDYVLIGGLAVQTHGHVRTTNDADLIPAPTLANLERLAATLRELGARVLNPG